MRKGVHDKGFTFFFFKEESPYYWERGFTQGGSWGSCEPPKKTRLRVCVGANSA